MGARVERFVLLALAACAPVEVVEATTSARTGHPRNTLDSPPDTVVLTMNLLWDDPDATGPDAWPRRRAGAIAMLTGADLIGTQEAMASQVMDLDAALPQYVRVSVATKLDPEQHDSMLFFRKDRYTALEEHHFWLSPTPDTPRSDGFERADSAPGLGPRSVTCVVLADRHDRDRELVFCNTHFDGDRLVNEASARLLAARLRARYPKRPTIVTGDFNALPFTGDAPDDAPAWAAAFHNTTYATLTDALVDTQAVLQPEHPAWLLCPKTECVWGLALRIDWILASRHFEVRSTTTLSHRYDGRAITDHWPIRATLRRALVTSRPVRVTDP